jgi:DNA-binding transcriptional regulator YiaG
MIDYALFSKIRHLNQHDGLTAQQIARELAMDVRTVKKWLDETRFRPRQSSPRASKLDPFKSDIVRLLQAHPYTAIQLLQRLREQGFEGG